MFGYPARDAAETKHLYGLMTTLLKYRREIIRLLRAMPKEGSQTPEETE
jgi:F420-0:gamma-glutamyl ligase-like protein